MQTTSYSIAKERNQSIAFWIFKSISFIVLALIVAILGFIIVRGIGVINWEFISTAPTDGMTKGGIFPAIVGTVQLIIGSSVIAFPIGILSGIYMNEYAKDNWFKKFVRMMTNNLAGIPSIVFGLFGMALFVNYLKFGVSILSGCLTLGLMILPIVIRTTEESLKFIEDSYRQAAYALGASKWQTIQKVILPMAFPNIITGLILSIGRVSGETAPIIFTVAAYYLPEISLSLHSQVMALPYHLYVTATSGTDLEASRKIAFGTALVLISLVFALNLAANYIRRRHQSKHQ
jgi:phosphate transport system permease protein